MVPKGSGRARFDLRRVARGLQGCRLSKRSSLGAVVWPGSESEDLRSRPPSSSSSLKYFSPEHGGSNLISQHHAHDARILARWSGRDERSERVFPFPRAELAVDVNHHTRRQARRVSGVWVLSHARFWRLKELAGHPQRRRSSQFIAQLLPANQRQFTAKQTYRLGTQWGRGTKDVRVEVGKSGQFPSELRIKASNE